MVLVAAEACGIADRSNLGVVADQLRMTAPTMQRLANISCAVREEHQHDQDMKWKCYSNSCMTDEVHGVSTIWPYTSMCLRRHCHKACHDGHSAPASHFACLLFCQSYCLHI